MKKIILLSLIVFNINNTWSQIEMVPERFIFSKDSFNYIPLVDEFDTLAIEEWYDYESESIPIGFDFYYQNVKVNNVYFSTTGFLGFSLNDISKIEPSLYYLTGYFTSNGIGKIKYATQGISPNRVFVLELKNVAIDTDNPIVSKSDSIDIQVRLYESSNVIKYHYGRMKLAEGRLDFSNLNYWYVLSPGIVVNNGDSIETHYNKKYVQLILQNEDSYSDTTLSALNSSAPEFVYSALYQNKINDNVAFVFTPTNGLSVNNNIPKIENIFYPNPLTDDKLFFTNKNIAGYFFTIYTLDGRSLRSSIIKDDFINCSDLNKGVYFLSITDKYNKKISSFSFIKK